MQYGNMGLGEISKARINTLGGKTATSTPKTLRLSGYGDGRTPVELMQAGRFDTISSCAHSFVSGDKNFLIENFPMTSDTDDVELEYVEFDHDPMSEEVIAEFARRDLERPTAEDALRFAEKYPEEQRAARIVFLHEPWRNISYLRCVLNLHEWYGERRLTDGLFDKWWVGQPRFAARRPRT